MFSALEPLAEASIYLKEMGAEDITRPQVLKDLFTIKDAWARYMQLSSDSDSNMINFVNLNSKSLSLRGPW